MTDRTDVPVTLLAATMILATAAGCSTTRSGTSPAPNTPAPGPQAATTAPTAPTPPTPPTPPTAPAAPVAPTPPTPPAVADSAPFILRLVMQAQDEAYDLLDASRRANWSAAGATDAGAKLASRLATNFDAVARNAPQRGDAAFVELAKTAQARSSELERALTALGGMPPGGKALPDLSQRVDALWKSCSDCHARYRD